MKFTSKREEILFYLIATPIAVVMMWGLMNVLMPTTEREGSTDLVKMMPTAVTKSVECTTEGCVQVITNSYNFVK